jgi:hypothetical protein
MIKMFHSLEKYNHSNKLQIIANMGITIIPLILHQRYPHNWLKIKTANLDYNKSMMKLEQQNLYNLGITKQEIILFIMEIQKKLFVNKDERSDK